MPAPANTSLIDVVDERDKPVGTVERGQALSRGVNFRTAHVFLMQETSGLLLQRLGRTRDRHARRWGSSVAAYLHAGEDYEEAAQRRLREELGLQLPLQSVGKIEMRDERSQKFVALFLGCDGEPAIREADHIDELEYWQLDAIDRALSAKPGIFTPTFQRLFWAFRPRLSST